jgi:hypothetical protein
MPFVSDVFAKIGEPCTIVRDTGDVATYVYFKPVSRWQERSPFERNALIPADSGIAEGDLVLHRSDYYLVINNQEDRRGEDYYDNIVRLYKCNAVVTLRTMNATTKDFEDSVTGINCLITPTREDAPEDMTHILSTSRSRYRGTDILFNCYMQSIVGLTNQAILVDGAGNQLRVTDDIDPYLANGITRAMVKIENYA